MALFVRHKVIIPGNKLGLYKILKSFKEVVELIVMSFDRFKHLF